MNSCLLTKSCHWNSKYLKYLILATFSQNCFWLHYTKLFSLPTSSLITFQNLFLMYLFLYMDTFVLHLCISLGPWPFWYILSDVFKDKFPWPASSIFLIYRLFLSLSVYVLIILKNNLFAACLRQVTSYDWLPVSFLIKNVGSILCLLIFNYQLFRDE